MVRFQPALLMIAASLFVLNPSHTLDAAPPRRLDPRRTQEDAERLDAALRAKGYVKYRNGNWGLHCRPVLS